MVRFRLPLLLLAACALLPGCGAGLVTGGLLGNRGGGRGSPPPIVPPRLALDRAESPLVGAEGNEATRILFVNNLQVTSSDIEVRLAALGVVSRQGKPLLLTATPTLSRIIFFESHVEILQALGLGRATEADIQAELTLLIDGQQVGEPIPYVLRRQPAAALAGGMQQLLLSSRGTTRVQLRVTGLLATDASEIEMRVITQDPDRPAGTLLVRPATGLTLETGSDGAAIVTGIAPPSRFAGQAIVSVKGQRSGLSTPVTTLFYAPELLTASSRFVAADGGSLVTLIGEGLAPLDLARPAPFPPAFDRLRLSFRKGGRVLEVDPALVRRDESGFERLVFTAPHSPDGRPGPAEIVVSADIGVTRVESASSRIFVYGHRNPVFGPRGVLLTERPRAFTLVPRTDLGSFAPHLALVSASGGIPRARLLVAQDNGIFAGFGAEFVAGDQGRVGQRDPIDLCAADWNGDRNGDLLVLNRGQGASAEHTVLLAQGAPAPPLERVDGAIDDRDAALCRVADFDRDGVPDVAVLPSPGAASTSPRLFLARPSTDGRPRFDRASLGGLADLHAPYDAFVADDLDGDGAADLAFLFGGIGMRLVVVYGDGAGGFAVQSTMVLQVPGYTPEEESPAIGLHACGAPFGQPRSLVLVLAGGSVAAPPTIAVLLPESAGRGYQQPEAGSVIGLANQPPLVCSVLGDLDRTGAPELVVAGSDGSTKMLRLFTWSVDRFVEVVNGVDFGRETMFGIRALAIAAAVPSDPPVVTDTRMGLFVSHRYRLEGADEERISTLLAAPGPRLVAPDASLQLSLSVEGLALGNFSGKVQGLRIAQDVVVAVGGSLVVLGNDGSGGLWPFSVHAAGGALAATLVSAQLKLPSLTTDGVVYLRNDGLIGVLIAGRTEPLLSAVDLRQLGPDRFKGRPPAASSRVLPADIDGDGVQDLVVFLAFPSSVGEDGEAMLMLLRGKVGLQQGDFPWHLPDGEAQAMLSHARASAIAAGDFAPDGPGERVRLELALAVPDDPRQPEAGNHIRFYRYDPLSPLPTDDRFVRSFVESERPVLIAGDQPEQLAAADFDGNGTIDLAVAATGDRRLHVFLNNAAVGSGDVDIRAFQETFSGPPVLPPGRPTCLFAADLNGDGVRDIVATALERTTVKSHNVAYYLSSGTGALRGPAFLPHIRTGNVRRDGNDLVVRDADLFPAVGDLNRDGTPDLVLGWSTTIPFDRNLHVLFGQLP